MAARQGVDAHPVKSRVCHVIHEYLGHTLNWVHTQIKYTPEFQHYVLASKTANLDAYPVDMIFTPRWRPSSRLPLLDRVCRHFGVYPPENVICFSRAIRKYPPALMHAHFGWDGFFALSLKRRFRIPMVTRFYGYDVGVLPKLAVWTRRYATLFREGDLFLVEGNRMRSALVDVGCPAGRVVVHHLGIEVHRIPYRARNYEGGAFRILIAASLVEKKGIEFALRAIRTALNAMPGLDLRVRIIGDGVLKDKLHRLADDLYLNDRIQWLGCQPHSSFLNELYWAHVLLSPSHTASDGNTEGGAPVAFLEAQASGLPVLSTFHADIPEIVLHGKTGILVPEKDSGLLAQAILTMVSRPTLLIEFGGSGRRHVQSHYEARNQGALLSEIYSELADAAELARSRRRAIQ